MTHYSGQGKQGRGAKRAVIPVGFQIQLSNKTAISRAAGRVWLHCENCFRPHDVWLCQAKRANHHFCSKSCRAEWERDRVEHICVHCGNIFFEVRSTGRSTCSQICSQWVRSAATFAINQKRKLMGKSNESK